MKNNNEWLTLNQLKEKVNNLANQYDNYTEYIDNYRQYQEAEKLNKRITQNVRKMRPVMEKFEQLEKEVLQKYPNAKLFYKKGNFKLVIGKVIKYCKYN